MKLFYRAREKYEIFHPVLRRSCVADRTAKSEVSRPVRFVKSAERDTPKLLAIGNEKVRTGSSAEIQFYYRATIYSDILPLENRSYMNQEKEKDKFFDSLSLSFSLTMRKSLIS